MSTHNGTKPTKQVPQNIEAERAVLGSLLLDNACIEDVVAILDPQDFYVQAHQTIYEACVEIFYAVEAVDLILLSEHLRTRGKLQEVGGIVMLAGLENDCASSGGAPDNARIVKKKAQARKYYETTARLMSQISDGLIDTPELLSLAQTNLSEIIDSDHGKDEWIFDDLSAMLKPQEPLKYLIRGVVPSGSLGMIYGAPASLKTMVGFEMLLTISGGVNFLETKPNEGGYSTIKTPTMVLNCDSPYSAVRGRISAGALSRCLTPEQADVFAWHPWGFDATDRRHMDKLRRLIDARGIGVVLVDCLGNIRGQVEENSAEMVRVVAGFRPLVEQMGCTVILIHHSRKDGETFRGSSAITSPLDWSYHAKREKGSEDVLLEADKQRLAPMPDLSARFCFDTVPGHPEELREFRFLACEPPYKQSQTETANVVLDAIKCNPGMAKAEVVAAAMSLGVPKNKVDGAIDHLLSEKRVRVEAGARGRLSHYATF